MYSVRQLGELAAPGAGGAQVPCKVSLSRAVLPCAQPPGELYLDLAASQQRLLCATDRGCVAQVSWTGQAGGRCERPSELPAHHARPPRLLRIHLCTPSSALACVWDTGEACVLSVDGEGDASWDTAQLRLTHTLATVGAVSVALCAPARLAAVGLAGGSVALHSLCGEASPSSTESGASRPLRTLSLADWGYSPTDTGAAMQLQWAPGGGGGATAALAVGFGRRGCVVWSASGCRLVHALRPRGGAPGAHAHALPPASARWSTAAGSGGHGDGGASPAAQVLDGGVAALAWAPEGGALLLAACTQATHLLEMPMACALPQRRVGGCEEGGGELRGGATHLLLTPDSLLILDPAQLHHGAQERTAQQAAAGGVSHDEGGATAPGGQDAGLPMPPALLQRVRAPRAYLQDHWPLHAAAVSWDGACVAACGRRGCALYDRRAGVWRLFGDRAQERALRCAHLLWLGAALAVVNDCAAAAGDAGGCAAELLVFPRQRLDARARLARMPLTSLPLACDAAADGAALLLAMPGGTVALYSASQTPATGALALSHTRTIHLTPSPDARPLLAVAFAPVADQLVLLRAGGELSLLDCSRAGGAAPERLLASEVDAFWMPPSTSDAPQQQPWWVYGPAGMRLLQPSDSTSVHPGNPGAMHASSAPAAQLTLSAGGAEEGDPELGFDRESQPLGIQGGRGAFVWLTQRLSGCDGELPCFEPAPRAQPLLPCLLRHLLRVGALAEAGKLAADSRGRPHFLHSLEWLLFTTLDAHCSRGGGGGGNRVNPGATGAAGARASSSSSSEALSRAVALCCAFPEFPDVVVSVARKTDEKEWRALFGAAGSPSALFSACLQAGRLRTAACYLLVIDKLEGSKAGQERALGLLQAALHGGVEYALAGELVRFLGRSGHEAALAEAEEEAGGGGGGGGGGLAPSPVAAAAAPRRASGGFLARLWPGSGGAATAAAAAAAAAEAALAARVHAALSGHARELLARRELLRLSALQRCAQFSLTAFMAAERPGAAARLGDFTVALNQLQESVGLALSAFARDALEAVLSACQRAGLLDWTALLGVLLGRRALLRDCFAADPLLWRAVAAALRSPALNDPDGRLAHLLVALEADMGVSAR